MYRLLLAASVAALLTPGLARAVDYYDEWHQRNQAEWQRQQQQLEEGQRLMRERQQEYNERLQQQQTQELLDGMHRREWRGE